MENENVGLGWFWWDAISNNITHNSVFTFYTCKAISFKQFQNTDYFNNTGWIALS